MRRCGGTLALAGMLLAGSTLAGPALAGPTLAGSPTADAFVASIGVIARPDRHAPADIVAQLVAIGVRAVRVSADWAGVAAGLPALCAARVGVLLQHDFTTAMTVERRLPVGCVIGVEGINEPILHGRTTQQVRDFQQALWTNAQGWDATVPVLPPSQAVQGAVGGDMTAWFNRQAAHIYCRAAHAPGPPPVPETVAPLGFTPCADGERRAEWAGHGMSLPHWITETGAAVTVSGISAVDQAHVVVRDALDGFLVAERTFVYQLQDDPGCNGKPNDTECNYGLFDALGTQRPAGRALGVLLRLLRSPSGTTTPADPSAVPFTFSGQPVDFRQLQLARNDNSVALVLWREDGVSIAFPSLPVTVCAPTPRTWSVSDVMLGTGLSQPVVSDPCVTIPLGRNPVVLRVADPAPRR